MKTIFLSTKQKIHLQNKPDIKSVLFLMNELDRLENIIRDYENGIDMLNAKVDSTLFKLPVDDIYNT